jgi:hypothetical protein
VKSVTNVVQLPKPLECFNYYSYRKSKSIIINCISAWQISNKPSFKSTCPGTRYTTRDNIVSHIGGYRDEY